MSSLTGDWHTVGGCSIDDPPSAIIVSVFTDLV